MDQSITTSLVDLYKAGANPMRTNPEKMQNINETMFVRSTHASREHSEASHRSSHRSRRRNENSTHSSYSDKSSIHSRQSRPPPPPQVQQQQPPNPPTDNNLNARFHANVHEDILREKHNEKRMYLHELERMRRSGGVKPSRDLSESDPFHDIEFEYQRVKQTEDQISTVSFIKDFIKLACTGIELGNSKLGLLRLDGWASECTSDMGRYDRPLNRLYARYWRRGGVSPIIELSFLVFGSLLIHHFKNIIFPSNGRSSQQQPSSHNIPPTRNVPFNPDAPRKRPTMKPPPSSTVNPPFMSPPGGGGMGGLGGLVSGGLGNLFGNKTQSPPHETRFKTTTHVAPPPVMFVNIPPGRTRRGKGPDVEIVPDDDELSEEHVIDISEEQRNDTNDTSSLNLDDL